MLENGRSPVQRVLLVMHVEKGTTAQKALEQDAALANIQNQLQLICRILVAFVQMATGQ